MSNVSRRLRASGEGSVSRRGGVWSATVSLWLVVCLLAVATGLAWSQDAPAPRAEVVLRGIEVTPPDPGAETLCKLTAMIENSGSRAAYSFAFDVEVNGHSLPVYEKQLFLQVIEAGQSEEVALFNFWTSESGRPSPGDGQLEVVVRLREARWVEVSEVDEEGETVEVWTPLGEVLGLPQTVRLTLALR